MFFTVKVVLFCIFSLRILMLVQNEVASFLGFSHRRPPTVTIATARAWQTVVDPLQSIHWKANQIQHLLLLTETAMEILLLVYKLVYLLLLVKGMSLMVLMERLLMRTLNYDCNQYINFSIQIHAHTQSS